MKPKIIVAIRHGMYRGDGSSESPLSEEGAQQVSKVSSLVYKYLRDTYGDEEELKVVKFGLSFNYRVVDSLWSLPKTMSNIVLWSGPFLTRKKEITLNHTKEVYSFVKKGLKAWKAEVAVVVSHGEMSGSLTEHILKTEFPNEVWKDIYGVAEATGCLINLETKEVFYISSDGLVPIDCSKDVDLCALSFTEDVASADDGSSE